MPIHAKKPEEILDENKENYELACTRTDPYYEDWLRAIDVVKAFIREHKLIIYGGTAIDYALRLKGDNIYSDEANAIPDLDFYSPDNVGHAYILADKFYDMGFESARAITATHLTTMRVDIGRNHWVADISYMPQKVFDNMPYIMYDNMRVIDPLIQRGDVHSSLSFPYDNPPREVIFARWSKDIKRFNKLDDKYPITLGDDTEDELKLMKTSIKCINFIFSGFLAYNVYYSVYKQIYEGYIKNDIISKDDKSMAKTIFTENVIPGTTEIKADCVEFLGYDKADFVIFDSEDELGDYKLLKKECYMPILPVKNYYSLCGMDEKYKTSVDFAKIGKSLLSIHKYILDGKTIRMANPQFIMMYFLTEFHSKNILKTSSKPGLYLKYYLSLLNMIRHVEYMYATSNSIEIDDSEVQDPVIVDHLMEDLAWLFMPSHITAGKYNISESSEMMLMRTISNYDDVWLDLNAPMNYKPEIARKKNSAPPTFNYEKNINFNKQGQLIT